MVIFSLLKLQTPYSTSTISNPSSPVPHEPPQHLHDVLSVEHDFGLQHPASGQTAQAPDPLKRIIRAAIHVSHALGLPRKSHPKKFHTKIINTSVSTAPHLAFHQKRSISHARTCPITAIQNHTVVEMNVSPIWWPAHQIISIDSGVIFHTFINPR